MFQKSPNGADGLQGGSGYQYMNGQGTQPDPGTGYMPPPGSMGGAQAPGQAQADPEPAYKHLFPHPARGEGGQESLYRRLFHRKPAQEGANAPQAAASQPVGNAGMQQGNGYTGTGYQAVPPQPVGYAGMQQGNGYTGAGYQAMPPQGSAYAGMQPNPAFTGTSSQTVQPAGYGGMQRNPGYTGTGYQATPQAAGYAGIQAGTASGMGYQQPPAQGPVGYAALKPDPAQGTGYQAGPQEGYTGMQQGTDYSGYQAVQQPAGYAGMQQAQPTPGQNVPPRNAQPGNAPQPAPENTPPQTPPPAPGGKPVTTSEDRRWRKIIQIGVVALAVVALAVYLVFALMPPRANYATIQAGMLGARYAGDALIVRNETPFVAEGVTSIQYVAEEGKMCLRSMPVCNVYSSGYSTKEIATLQDYRDQIRDYQLSLLNAETTYDAKMARVESDVLSQAKEVRDIMAGTRGNLGNLEKMLGAAITARQQYLKTKYANDQRMSRLYDDERAQQQRINSWTKQYAATSNAIVSFYSDGYEFGLTTTNFEDFTPAEVRRMIRGEKPATSETMTKGRTTIYRTIRDGSWNVLFLVRDQNWNPVEGQMYELQLENFRNTTVQAKVLSFTRSGGELLVRLSVEGDVTPVLYMRTCTAELGDYVSTLMVPSRAIYTQDEMQGVVIVDGSSQAFVPIQVVYRDGDNVYITSITQGLLQEGQTVRLF